MTDPDARPGNAVIARSSRWINGPTRQPMTSIRPGAVLLGLAAFLSLALSACGGGSGSTAISGSTTTQSGSQTTQTTQGGSSTTGISVTTEYLTIVAPVDVREKLFKDSTTVAETELRAGPFASALETWSAELSGFSWPTAAQGDVRTLIADIPPLVTDLRDVAAGDFADVSKARIDGAPVTAGAKKVRTTLDCPQRPERRLPRFFCRYCCITSRASPSTISTPGWEVSRDGGPTILRRRLPPPRTRRGREVTLLSTQIGKPSGRPKAVTPPMAIPVSARVRSRSAKDAFLVPSRSLTA